MRRVCYALDFDGKSEIEKCLSRLYRRSNNLQSPTARPHMTVWLGYNNEQIENELLNIKVDFIELNGKYIKQNRDRWFVGYSAKHEFLEIYHSLYTDLPMHITIYSSYDLKEAERIYKSLPKLKDKYKFPRPKLLSRIDPRGRNYGLLHR